MAPLDFRLFVPQVWIHSCSWLYASLFLNLQSHIIESGVSFIFSYSFKTSKQAFLSAKTPQIHV